MKRPRIIPTMLLQGSGFVKTKKFKNAIYLGDPINLIKIFNDKGVDEIAVLDILASKEKHEPNFELIEKFASECFMPLMVGGGIHTLEHARRIFRSGVEKVCLRTAALSNTDLIENIAYEVGSQSVSVCIDVKKNLFGKYEVTHPFLKGFEKDPVILAKKLELKGAGEILVQSVDQEGTRKGYDLELIEKVSKAVHIPVVASGGANTVVDLAEVILKAGASAAAAGSMFVLHGPHDAVLVQYPQEEDIFQAFNKEA